MAPTRFSGEIRVEHYQDGEIVDQYVTEDAIWELMYFGARRSRQPPKEYPHDRRWQETVLELSRVLGRAR